MRDAVATMGNVLPEDVSGRDAVHVAVFSAVSCEKLFPGQDVGIKDKGPKDIFVESNGDLIGIVDPFLKSPVFPGTRFWVYLYPRTITGLMHYWSHPAFEDQQAQQTPKAISEEWLRDFCRTNDCPSYEVVMGVVSQVADGGNESTWDSDFLHFDGVDAHGEIPDEFWAHAEVVLGRSILGPKAKFFSCAC